MIAATLDFLLKSQLKKISSALNDFEVSISGLLKVTHSLCAIWIIANKRLGVMKVQCEAGQASVDLSTSLTYTLEKTNISNPGRSNKIFKSGFQRRYDNRLVPRRLFRRGFKVCESFMKRWVWPQTWGAGIFPRIVTADKETKHQHFPRSYFGGCPENCETHMFLCCKLSFIIILGGPASVFLVFDLRGFLYCDECPWITFIHENKVEQKDRSKPLGFPIKNLVFHTRTHTHTLDKHFFCNISRSNGEFTSEFDQIILGTPTIKTYNIFIEKKQHLPKVERLSH